MNGRDAVIRDDAEAAIWYRRAAAVLYKYFVFSSLPIRKGLVLSFLAVFLQRVYSQDRRSYYLFFTT